MKNLLKIAASTILSLLAACSTAPQIESTSSVPKPAPTVDASPPIRTIPVTPPYGANSADPLNDPNGILAKRSIYFDFDDYTVNPKFNDLNIAHANYLINHADRTVVIQGNTDSRGGTEYNLALGQKRAEAETKILNLLGVPNSRMEAVSFGKEEPKATGENEAAWAENRRDDIVYSEK